MAFTISKDAVITYQPNDLRAFHVHGFEWIDNLHFLVAPSEFVGSRASSYIEVAKERFLEAGWEGDGEVRLLWLPPFAFPLGLQVPPAGVVLWHVKQEEDGVSFILSPFELPFEEFTQ
jgi:hypothetical protein